MDIAELLEGIEITDITEVIESLEVQPEITQHDLEKLNKLCGKLMVGKNTSQQLFDNLKTIHSEIEAHQIENKLSQKDINQFFKFVHETNSCIEKYVNKNIVYCITNMKIMKEEMEKLNKDVYKFCKRLNIPLFKEIEVCEKQWYGIMEEYCLNDSFFSDQFLSLGAQLEIIMTLSYELNMYKKDHNQWSLTLYEQDHDKWSFKQLRTLRLNVIRALGKNMCYTPDWFIPSERVEYNKEMFVKGTYESIHRGIWINGLEYTIKFVDFDENCVGASLYDEVALELDQWFGCNHPNIAKLHGGSHVSTPAFIVSEYGSNGNLNTYLKKNKHKMWRMLHEAAMGLEYLHERNIVHGNLKLNNLIVGSDEKVKLTDIGLNTIRKSSRSSSVSNENIFSDQGSQSRAPECSSINTRSVQIESEFAFASDVYSFGMCLIEAATDATPFAYRDTHDITLYAQTDENTVWPKGYSDEEWKLIGSMTHLNPNERVNLADVVEKLKSFAEKEGNECSNTNIRCCVSCSHIMESNTLYCHECSAFDEVLEEYKYDGAINVVTESDTISVIIDLLINGSDSDKLAAVKELSNLAANIVNHQLIVDAGGIFPLINLVMNGNDYQKTISAGALRNLAWNNNTNKQLIADAGGVIPLINLVMYGNDDQKTTAAGALRNLAMNDKNQQLIADAGGIIPLINLVMNGNNEQKTTAAGALRNLAWNNDTNKQLIADAGGISPFINLVMNGIDDKKTQAAAVLRNLAMNDTNIQLIADAGGIIPLINLAINGNDDQKAQAAGALRNLAWNNDTIQQLIADACGIIPLINLVMNGNDDQKAQAATALMNLALNDTTQQLIADAGGIIPLINLVMNGNNEQKTTSAGALRNLAMNDTIQQLTDDAGGIIPLINLVMNVNDDQKTDAAAALAKLDWNNDTNQQLIADAGVIPSLIDLVKNGADNIKTMATVALIILAHKNDTNKKMIVDADGITTLIGLARIGTDKQTTFAIQVLRSLASNNGEILKLIADSCGLVLLVEILKNGAEESMEKAARARRSHAIGQNNKRMLISSNGIIPVYNQVRFGTSDEREAIAKELTSGLIP